MERDNEEKEKKKKYCCKKGPCACLGMTNTNGTKLFSYFDLFSGLAVMIPSLVIFLEGEKKTEDGLKFYPLKTFNFTREVIIFGVFIGSYTAATSFLLFLSVYCRNMGACYAWLILNLPFSFVNPLKLYESVVVYHLAQEIMEEDRAMNFFFDQVANGGPKKKPKTARRMRLADA